MPRKPPTTFPLFECVKANQAQTQPASVITHSTSAATPIWPATPAHRVAALGGVGVLNTADVADLDAGCLKVLAFMRDGKWHDATSIIEASGQREGLRRMRELRRLFKVERRRLDGKRDFEYRLTQETHE